MEQWQINRAGIINFWYYDDEEFHFESGRLLLRGANGSGKSVTMQSLVPLLFDGNKSPERLDPFGSRARRMDSYLLSDGLDLEERTGYLFLEFAKPESERFMTIGMGMRARKNMPMQTWYYIIWDNRRLGAAYDLSLFKDVGVKLPLTQRELENRVGSGGQVFSKQGDYKRAVNDHLFGYADLTDFDELIALLIQIRSPKLSKEFKPTTMYEIMQNSLVTLTEEDLRPMSEAIENMDEIQETIETLKESMKAIGRIDAAYSKYNQFLLASKAKRYVDLHEEADRMTAEARQMKRREASLVEACETLGHKLQGLEEEQEQLRRKVERLGAHDLSKLAHEKVELESTLEELKNSIATKENQVTEGVTLQGQLDRKIRENLEDLEALLKDRKNLLARMDGSAEISGFDEHAFFTGDYEKQTSPPFDFSGHQRQLTRYREQLRRGYQLLRESERLQRAYEELLEKRDAASHDVEHQRQTVREHERQFAEIKEEFAEKTFAWGTGQEHLSIERQVLQQVVERVYRYGDPYRFDQVIAPAREAYEEARQAVRSEISGLQGRAMNLEEELRLKREEWERLEAQVEPEPARTPAVMRNRHRLREAGVAHLPLYRAIDFDRSVPDKLRGPMEEALDDLGILDALVIAPDDRERALAMDPGMADKYLFAEPKILSQNLAQYMKPDTGESTVSAEQIDNAIRSILLNPDQGSVFIDETGSYGMGIVRGKSAGDRPSRFIGYQSRKRYKAELLGAIEGEMQTLQEQLTAIEEAIGEKNVKLQSYQAAWSVFPGQADLDLAHRELAVQQQKQHHLNSLLEELNARCDGAYHALKTVQRDTHEATHKILLAPRSAVYDEALEALGDYRADLQRLENTDQRHLHLLEKMQSLEEQLERCEDQLDEARYELNQMVARRVSTKQRRDHIERELELKDYDAVIRELEQCRKRLDALPALLKETVIEQTATQESLKRLNEDLKELDHRGERMHDKLRISGWALEKELSLGYTQLPQESNEKEEPLKQSADEVLRTHGEMLKSGKTLMDYRDTVNSRYLAEGGDLLEYNLKGIILFKETPFEGLSDDDRMHIERLDIQARVQGRTVGFYEMKDLVERQIQDHGSLLEARDRQLFEETLINTVSRKISSKIYHSEKWVDKIDALMTSMNTSSGLKFNLRWKTKKAESEDQLSTQELVEILKGEPSLMTREKKDRLIAHFRSKINQMRERMKDAQEERNFLTLMKEVLDYRKWFEFQLYFTKMGERKKELTNNAFYTFSGGEKAMAMYVPLFSAVYAKYQGGEADCPKVISLDEAFAGVDEKNIEDMFRLLVELDLSFIANSQVLFGDYETIPDLGIYELIRPENVTYVTLIHYLWNGRERHLVNDGIETLSS